MKATIKNARDFYGKQVDITFTNGQQWHDAKVITWTKSVDNDDEGDYFDVAYKGNNNYMIMFDEIKNIVVI
jgi:hypothetical protein